MTLKVGNYKEEYDAKAHGVVVNKDDLPEGTTLYYNTTDPSSQGFDDNWSPKEPKWTDVELNGDTPKSHKVYVKAVNPNYNTAYGNADVTILQKQIKVHGEDTKPYTVIISRTTQRSQIRPRQ